DLFTTLAGRPDPSGGSGGGVEEPEPPNEGDCVTPCFVKEPRTPKAGACVTSVSAGLQQPGHPEVSDLENQFCGTRCAHLGVRQRSLRSCRLEPHQPMAWSCCGKRTRRHRCLSTADLEKQFCATPSYGVALRTPRLGFRVTHSLWRNRKKILNRGNELKDLLKTDDL